MTIKTPKYRGILWAVANVSFVAVVPAAALYFSRQLRAGAYPEEADSIGLPIVGIAFWVLILLLPLNIAWGLLLRRYPGKVVLYASARDLRLAPRIIAELGLAVGVLCVVAAVWSLVDDAPEFTAVFLLWCYVALAVRAAFVMSARTKKTHNSGLAA